MKTKIKNKLLNAMIEIIRTALIVLMFMLAFSIGLVALVVSAFTVLPVMSVLYMVDKREGISTSIFKAIEDWLKGIIGLIAIIMK